MKRNSARTRERELIRAFVAHLAEARRSDLRGERWPEDDNRNDQEIDAVAGTVAIEHTSVDSLPNQRRDAKRFARVVADLEDQVPVVAGFCISVVFDYGAIAEGQDWMAIRAALRDWLQSKAAALPNGRTVHPEVPGVPFPVTVFKHPSPRAAIKFGRYDGEDVTFSDRIREQLLGKAEKLKKYKAAGFETALLVENDDLARMNPGIMLEALRAAFPAGLPAHLDRLWYVDTSIPGDPEFREFPWDEVAPVLETGA